MIDIISGVLVKLNNCEKTALPRIPARSEIEGIEKADTVLRTNIHKKISLYPVEMKKLIVSRVNKK